MQTIRDSPSNHHVHWLQLANFSINELLLRLFLDEPICFLEILILLMCRFWRSNLEFQHCVGIAPKNHHNHTSLLIFQVIGGIFCSFGSNFCVLITYFLPKSYKKRENQSKSKIASRFVLLWIGRTVAHCSPQKSCDNTKMKLPELFFGWVKRSKDAKLTQLNTPLGKHAWTGLSAGSVYVYIYIYIYIYQRKEFWWYYCR